jgi:hypothetical protein
MIKLQLMGSEPLFVAKFTRRDTGAFIGLFSTQEIAPDETQDIDDFEGQPVRGYVETFGQFSTVQQIQDFGSIQSMTVVLNDNFGYFKTLLETYNLYDIAVDLYLLIRQPMIATGRKLPSCTKIFSGKIGTPISWKEGERQLDIMLVSGVIFEEFGYVPEFLGVQGVELNLNTEPWPHIFGTVSLFELLPFCNVPTAHTTYNIHFLHYMPAHRVQLQDGSIVTLPGGFPTYPDIPTDKYYDNGFGFTGFYTVEPAQLPGDINTFFSVDIPGGGSVLFKGTVVGNLVQIMFEGGLTTWNTPWYTDLVTWSPPQYNATSMWRTDDSAYVPNTVVLMGYGSITIPDPSNWQFNVYDELVPPTAIDIPFPIDYGIGVGQPGWWSDITYWQRGLNTPWLKDLYIRMLVASVYRDENNQPKVNTAELWAKVVNQEGINLYLDEIRTMDDQEVLLNGCRVLYIYEATKNKIFKPFSTELYDRPALVAQKMQENPETYLDHRYTITDPLEAWKYHGVYDLAFTIPNGSEIKAVSWWGNLMYPVSLDQETYYVEVYVTCGNRLMQLDRKSQYALMRYKKTELGGVFEWQRVDLTTDYEHAPVWSIATPSNSPLPQMMYDIAIEHWPDEFTFIIINKGSYLQLLKDVSGTDPLTTVSVYAKNHLKTDELAFEFLVNKYTTFTPYINPDTFRHHPLGFGVREKNNTITTFLARLAFEHAKQIRIKITDINMQDLLDLDRQIAFTFTEKYLEARSLELTYTGDDEIVNYLKISAADEWATGYLVIRNIDSIHRYTERKANDGIEILTNRVFDTYTGPPELDPGDPANTHWTSGDLAYFARGYNRVMYYWLYMWSHAWQRVLFTTYLEAGDLVGADYVQLYLQQALEFLPSSEAGVMQFPLNGDGLQRLPSGKGIVLEMTIDPTDWVVSLNLQLPTMLGDERG